MTTLFFSGWALLVFALLLYDWCLKHDVWTVEKLLTRFLQCRDIRFQGDLYMRRWYVIRSGRLSVFIHRIVRSDYARHLHDHPWDFIAVLLSGTYTEVDSSGMHVIGRFLPRFRRAEYQHRLVLDDEKEVWSLFIHLRRRREWGFQTEQGWIDHSNYNGMMTMQDGVRPE
jgi:hypothetical protein